jgi:hypothetical protein
MESGMKDFKRKIMQPLPKNLGRNERFQEEDYAVTQESW